MVYFFVSKRKVIIIVVITITTVIDHYCTWVVSILIFMLAYTVSIILLWICSFTFIVNNLKLNILRVRNVRPNIITVYTCNRKLANECQRWLVPKTNSTASDNFHRRYWLKLPVGGFYASLIIYILSERTRLIINNYTDTASSHRRDEGVYTAPDSVDLGNG